MRNTLIVTSLLIFVLIGLFFFEHFLSVIREMKVFSKNNLIKNASFENGLDGWEIDDKKDPVLLILGARSVKFTVKPEHLNSELTLEYMPSSTYRGLYTTHVQFDMHFSDQQYPIRITYELKSNIDSEFSMSTDPQNYYVNYHLPMKVEKDRWNTFKPFPIANINEAFLSEGLQELNINKLDKIEGRFLTSWIFDPNSVKFKGWNEYFELEEDPYPETKEISRFDPSTDLPKIGIESLGGIPSDGNNFLNVPGKYSYIYQKIANLDKRKIYALIFDAKSESLPIHPPKVIITNRDNVPIIEKVVTPQSAQLGWVRSVVLFKPNTDEIIIKLGTGAVDGYYPFTINQYDNFKLHDVAYTQKFIDFINHEYDVNISLDFVKNIIDESNEFSVDYSKIIPADFANKLQEDYSSLNIPVYDISVDEYTMWRQPLAKYLMWNGLDMVENKDRRYYAYRFEDGYKNMVPATLNVGGYRIGSTNQNQRSWSGTSCA